MMFDIPAQIEYISSITRLEPGDIIATGTPAGAGLGSGAKALAPGHDVVCEIEGIGKLRNTVAAA
jgi:2-keto-4-pentenoate hydratase/2-oxohepta-3-ene-1,7-dioic acid hydratase in catechol pathway